MTEKQRVEAGSGTGGARPGCFMPPLSIIWLLGIALVAALVYVSRDFVLLLFLSATLAYLLNPIVKIAESALIKRHVAVTVIYLTTTCCLTRKPVARNSRRSPTQSPSPLRSHST